MKKTTKKKEYVYLVGHGGPEHNLVFSVHKSHNGALKAWNKLRMSLLKEVQHGLQRSKEDSKRKLKEGKWYDNKPFTQENIDYFKEIAEKGDEMYLEMIEKLSCEDPEKIDNYPHDTPYIEKHKVEN